MYMNIDVSKKEVSWWKNKGMTPICFSEEGNEGIFREKGTRETLFFVTGKKKSMTRRTVALLARRAVREAALKKCKDIVFDVRQFRFPSVFMSERELGEWLAINFLMADFSFRDFLSQPKEGFLEIRTIVLAHATGKDFLSGVKRGIIIGEEVNRSRYISTMPGGEMTPKLLAKHARQSVKGLPVRVTVFDEREIKRQKMGGIVGVGSGSHEKPRFIILEYLGTTKKEQPIVLVGKGVTFDTGGINLKPSDALLGMNMDMSGGAAVIHTIAAAARLRIRKNIIALVPAVENMPSGSSYRPGDILRSMSGKTIEVLNTDAEGRIILADALHYAKRYRPKLVVDVATLTGAALVALGERASALFTEDESLEKLFREAGEESNDPVWPLPLWDEYAEDIKGVFGDVANMSKTPWGGAITAAVFLKQFVDHAYPFVHLDIAPRMTTLQSEFLSKGSAGASIQLLLKVLEKL
ncbi:MAG: leucyl aminopeptidase family protein [Candidatus Moranbacteria bacterium]|nr:leucyl aminopeptidase family protein [Candidatus Moranbacteria bacterium]